MIGPSPKAFGPNSRQMGSKGLNKQLTFNVALSKSFHFLILVYKIKLIKSIEFDYYGD